ncbi:hypothetical protein [Microbacterium sp.]|jgi:hypothetical protein|uniref:hypothetical protein n=1 Tax=Microbacterium sp. TaxID=51671 RepID=UPI0025DED314|nr:hypothetical protein [Microbacterium sp.]
MSEDRRSPGDVPDDDREVPLEDEAEWDGPDPTIDPRESIELGESLESEIDQFERGFEG